MRWKGFWSLVEKKIYVQSKLCDGHTCILDT
jgi:hypothetical protein